MTRKRRLTRSRQSRRRIHGRTRQTFAQVYRLGLEAAHEAVIHPGVHPFVKWAREKHGVVGNEPRSKAPGVRPRSSDMLSTRGLEGRR